MSSDADSGESKLRVHVSPWGLVGPRLPFDSLDELLPAAAAAGYAGIEMPLIAFEAFPEWVGELDPPRLRDRLEETGLSWLPMVLTFGATYDDHLADFRRQAEVAATWRPALINVHAGADAFDDDDAEQFLLAANEIASDLGLMPAHETHRGRILNTPWRTARLLHDVPSLWLTADLSHWVVTCERIPTDRQSDLDAALARTRHIHARVGFNNGPQVPDPRRPEWAPFVEAHERWWRTALAAMRERGDPLSTTPEWGAPTYAITDRDGQPLADNWELVDWSVERLHGLAE